ncbi:hypothetical protein NDU88_003739 [Pleurodeles waltl]|uniref:Uncharacterized protein n=1 Tax=Pleurodeles waltl TaxID=8319 RepID=A0AAV7V0W5_PLEWA|nr:hypothetical protein NDU88_003739 [Pleurodeles waltl]
MLAMFTPSKEPPGIPFWRTRTKALTDPVFSEVVRETVDHYFAENWGSVSTRGTEWDALKVELQGEFLKVKYGVKQQLTRSLDALEQHLGTLEHMVTERPQTLMEWKKCKQELLETWDHLEKCIHTSYRQQLHKEGDNASRMFASLLRTETRVPRWQGFMISQGLYTRHN